MTPDILKAVQEALEYSLGTKQADPGATLASLGAESLDLVEIAICLEDEFDITIPDDESPGAHWTVSQIVGLIERLKS